MNRVFWELYTVINFAQGQFDPLDLEDTCLLTWFR